MTTQLTIAASRKQPSEPFPLANLFDTDRHCGGPVGDVLGLGALCHLGEGHLQQPVQFVVDLGLGPEQLLQVLDPFEVGDNHAARIAQNVGDDED
jgi:hypothetical protein